MGLMDAGWQLALRKLLGDTQFPGSPAREASAPTLKSSTGIATVCGVGGAGASAEPKTSWSEKRRRSLRRSPGPLCFALEPRFLFDGAAVATAADVGHKANSFNPVPAPDPLLQALANHVLPADPTAGVAAPTQVRAVDPSQNGGKKEVAFVDTSTPGYQSLADGVRAGVEVEVIDGGQSGLAQIAKWAGTHSGYDAIHLITHGSEATLRIGSDSVTNASLGTAVQQMELAEVGHALAPGGNLLLYGCDVAKGIDGQQLVNDIAAATGSDVAASDNRTGAAAMGGDWVFEYNVGTIEAPLALTDAARDAYARVLAPAHEAPTADALALIPDVAAPTMLRAADPSQDGGKREVVFIDSSVAGYQTLVDGVRAGVEIELIDGGQSGLAQMAVWAETHSGYDAIHVLSRGAEGNLYLGTDTITHTSLGDPVAQTELAEIGSALNAGGDFLIYGSEAGKGSAGQQLVTDLSTDIGVVVSASTDVTGASALGGNWTLETGSPSTSSLDLAAYGGLLSSLDAAAASGGTEVVVVDTSVADYQAIIAAVNPGTQIITIDGATQGLHDLVLALAGRSDIDAIHIVSHGWDGQFHLGKDFIWDGSLGTYQGDLQALGQTLKQGGSILLYGCDVAQTDYGRDFIGQLHTITGAGIAASSDRTGSTSLAANWTLEAASGAVAAKLGDVFSQLALDQFTGSLATYTVTSNAASGAGSFLAAYTSANVSGSSDTITFDSSTFDPGSKTVAQRTITLGANLANLTCTSLTINGDVNGDSIPDVILSGNGAYYAFNATTAGNTLTLQSIEMKSFYTASGTNSPVYRSQVSSGYNTLNITDCIFDNNNRNVSSLGGGVMSLIGNINYTIDRSAFYSNISGWWGGAIYTAGNGTGTIRNSVFYDNQANVSSAVMAGGAIALSFSLNNNRNLTIDNVTMVGNSAPSGAGGGIAFQGVAGSITILNCIITDNTSASGSANLQNNNYTGTLTLTSNATTSGSVSFINAAGRDYRLASSDTGALNKGSGAATSSNDSWGNPRSIGTLDIGAFESNTPRTLTLDANSSSGASSGNYRESAAAAQNVTMNIADTDVTIGALSGDTNVRSVVLFLSGILDGSSESLSLTGGNPNINSVMYDTATGRFILYSKAGATDADMQAAIRNIQYKNAAASPTAGARTVNVVVSDASDSTVAAATLTLVGANAAPTATITSAPDVTTAGGTSYVVQVTYADSDGTIDASTIGSDDLTVSGLTYSSYTIVSGSGTNSTVVDYTFTPPGGSWDSADNATYTIALGSGPVKDNSAAAVSSLTAGSADSSITVNVPASPTITSATYDEGSHTLAVTGTNMTTGDTIDASKLTLSGAGTNYTLVGSYTVTASSGATFSLTLTGADVTGVEGVLDKNGTVASNAATYNLAAAAGWDSTASAPADTTSNAITVSKVPTITSATYNEGTGTLVVTGTDLTAGVNDLAVNKLTLKGEGGVTYTLTSSNVTRDSATQFTVALNASDQATVNTLLNKNGTASVGGTTFNLAAADDWDAGHTAGNTAQATIGVTVSNLQQPTVTSATYDAAAGSLVVTGTGLLHKGAGGTDDIVANTLTFTGEGGSTYTLTDTSNVDVTDAGHFTISLSATDKAALNLIFNKNGGTSTSGTTYNLAAAANWEAAYVGAADLTGNTITVSNVAVPTITSATYNEATGALVVTGTGFLKLSGATNDLDVSKLSISGQGGVSYTLTSASVEITDGTTFSVTLNATDKLAVNALLNKAGTQSAGGTTYNLAAAEDWAAGADTAVVVADLAGNGITASNLQTPTVTSAVYNQLTGQLTVTATNLLSKTGVTNDIDVTKLTITGQGGGGGAYTLTAATSNVEIDSATQFTVTVAGADKTAVDLLLNAVGTQSSDTTTYNVAAANGWMADWVGNGVDITDATSGITVAIPPTITSATYNATTGTLVVTGANLQALAGATNDIDVTKLTLTGEGGTTFALTNNTSNVEIDSATQFTVTLGATDKAALNQLLNKAGTSSTGNTTYNLAGAANWDAGFTLSGAADATNAVTVSAVPVPTITSATYDASTGTLVVTGTDFLKLNGANNDINVAKLALRGEGGGNPGYVLTSGSVDITDATHFTVTLNATDKAAVNLIMNKNGTSPTTANPPYLIRGLEDWDAGAEASVTIADLFNNTVTVSNVSAPAITSATYDASAGTLVVTGTGFTRFNASNDGDDILANKLSFVGEGGGAGYTLTDTANVDVTSPTSFTLTLSATDQAALNLILNKNGTSSTSGTTYNLVAATGFDQGDSTTAGDATNAIAVSNVAVPAITSAAYDYSANTLTFTGTGFLSKSGATNDIDVTKLTITGEGGATYTLVSSASVEVTSGTSFTVTLTGADLYNVEALLDQNGTTAFTSNTTFNVAAAAGWNRGDSTSGADATNTITVSNWAAPTVTSATYDASTGVLVVTGTDLVNKSGATNDIDVTKLTIAGEGGSYALTVATANVELTSATSFSLTLGAADKLAIDGLLNKNGTQSSGATTYNLAAAANWDAGSPSGAADLTSNGITVSNVQTPTITSSTYNANTGVLTVTASHLFAKVGATNDIDVTKLTLKGAGNGTYTLTADTSNVEVTSATAFTVTLGSTDKAQVNALLDTLGTSSGATPYNLAAADHWLAGADSATNIQDMAGNSVTVTIDPAITGATYNASTGALVLTGTNFQATGGALNDIVANKFVLTGEGGATYTLTDTSNVEITSATAATLTLSATDKAALNLIFNKSGTASSGNTTYNVAVTAGWDAAVAAATDATTPVTVSSVSAPTITSATYNASTGALVLTGTGFVHKGSAGNDDLLANTLTLTGEGGATYTLTDTANVDVTSGTTATLTLSATDKAALNLIFNKNGTTSSSNTTYNLAAAAGFDQGDSSNAADATNGVTVSAVSAPTITSATYDASTGVLVVTGTGFVVKSGATNDIQANKLTLTGEGNVTYTLTNTSDVEVTSSTSFTLTLSATDKTALAALVNKDGTASTGNTTYNLSAAAGFDRGDSSTAADLTNAVTASNTNQAPTAGAATVSNSGKVTSAFANTATGITVQVTYSDVDGNLNAGTIDVNDLTITRTSGSGSTPVVTGVTTSVNGNSITATYTIKPASSANWSDSYKGSFRIDLAGSQVSDSGTLSVAAASGIGTFSVDTTPPVITAGKISVSGASGTGGAFKVGDTVTATWDNTASGDNNPDTVSGVTMDLSQFGGGAAVVASNSSGTWTASYTIVDGAIDATGRNVTVTATDWVGNTTTTAGTSNVSVDDQPAVVTDAKISISGASGLGGAYKIGDTVTATWLGSGAGSDGNTDTLASVTANFSQFGGGTAVAMTNSGGTWTATYTIAAGAIDATNRNVSVTVTDNAGNVTTTADSTNATVDDIAPTVTAAKITVSGATGTGGVFKVGDTVTATWNNSAAGDNNADDLSGVTMDFSQFGGGTAVAATNNAGTWTATYIITAGAIDTTNRNVSVTTTDNAGNATTTAGTDNKSVDDQPPTLTATNISLSGATGTGGTYKVGDTVTASWNNSAAGDNNADTISGVTFDFTQFGGGAAVAASNSGGTWTATYTITAGAIDTTNRNVSATATDNAGNTTTTAGTSNASVDDQPAVVTDAKISISGASGLGGAYKIGDTVTATWNNTGAGDNNTDTLASVTADFSQFGGGSAVAMTNSGGTWTATYTLTAGAIDTTSRNVSVTVTDNAGNVTTTADSTNATVDTIAPTVTASKITISGASGTGGAFKVGDTVTATWNNSAAGDNNADTISGVTFDFTQFGGGAAVAASNSGGTWTATYTIVAGAIDTTSRNVAATVTDNAGNTTTIAGTSNASVDDQPAVVTDAKISISGASGLGGAYKIGDTVTATWLGSGAGSDGNTDTLASVTANFSQFGGGTAVAMTSSGGTWTASYTITAGAIDATNRNVSVTVTDNAGNVTTTADGTNATVDNVAPTVTAGKVSFSGASGTGGAFKIGDTITATWDNSGSGDNNSDTLSSVTFDLSQFGGGTAVAATRSGAYWNATYTVTAGSLDASGLTATVTVVDNAGNSAVRTSSATATVDSISPTVSASRITLSGATGLSGAYKIGDTVTATWNNSSRGDANSDAISTVYFDLSQFGGDCAVKAGESDGVWTASYTLTAGSIDATGRTVTAAVTDHVGNAVVKTSSTTATVDSIAPNLTTGGITLSGATGADGSIFKIGDTVTATWNTTSGGDNEADTMASVKVDFSQFGGGTAVSASNSSGIWTAKYTLTAGSLDSSSKYNVTVTATDNAGNAKTVSGTNNGRVDNQAPDAPDKPNLSSDSDTGVSNSDGITKITTPTFTGSAEPKSTITLYDSDGRTVLGTTTANSSGDWKFTLPNDLSSGSHTIRVTATDQAGNVSKMSSGTTVIIETRVPTVSDPGLKASPGADSGTTVGVVSGSDPGGQSLQFQLVDDYGGHFAIDPATGKVTIANPIDTDTTAKSFQITVRVTNAAGLSSDKVLTIEKGTYVAPVKKVDPLVVTVIPTTVTQTAVAPVAPSVVASSSVNNGGANGPGSSANTPSIGVGSVGSTDTGAGNSGSRLISTSSMNGGSTDTTAGNSGSRLITTSSMNNPSSGSSISNASSVGPSGGSGGGSTVAATFSESVGGGGFGASSTGFTSSSSGASSNTGTGGFSRSTTGGTTPSTTGGATGTSGRSTTGEPTSTGTGGLGDRPQQTPRSGDGGLPQGTPQTRGPQGQGEGGPQGQRQPGQPQGQQAPEQGQPERGQQGQGNGQGGQPVPSGPQPHAYLFAPTFRSFSDQLADAAGKFDRGRDALIESAKAVAKQINRNAA